MPYPDDCKYTKDHEWIRVDGSAYAVGITSYAEQQLGDVTYVELPEVGKMYKQGQIVASVESVKAASDIYAPITGVVTEINEQLEGAPELVNQSPYDEGWFFRLDDVTESELRLLMDAKAYEAYIQSLA